MTFLARSSLVLPPPLAPSQRGVKVETGVSPISAAPETGRP
jgi:hypothetical protein